VTLCRDLVPRAVSAHRVTPFEAELGVCSPRIGGDVGSAAGAEASRVGSADKGLSAGDHATRVNAADYQGE
jgi:hypothetical protein